jgi:hypothetical protein
MVDEAVQLADGFLDLDLRAGQQLDRAGHGAGVRAESGQPV